MAELVVPKKADMVLSAKEIEDAKDPADAAAKALMKILTYLQSEEFVGKDPCRMNVAKTVATMLEDLK